MSDYWLPPRQQLRFDRFGSVAVQASCHDCREVVPANSTKCEHCGETFLAYVTPYEAEREYIERLTKLSYQYVEWH